MCVEIGRTACKLSREEFMSIINTEVSGICSLVCWKPHPNLTQPSPLHTLLLSVCLSVCSSVRGTSLYNSTYETFTRKETHCILASTRCVSSLSKTQYPQCSVTVAMLILRRSRAIGRPFTMTRFISCLCYLTLHSTSLYPTLFYFVFVCLCRQ